MEGITRRIFLKSAAAAAVTAANPLVHAAPPPAAQAQSAYLFLNSEEARFIEAAVARLIPADAAGPGALEAGVPNFIDKQLAGAWGAGERLYRSGPWREGTPSQGYQLPFTPAELFRAALRAIDKDATRRKGRAFAELAAQEQDAYLDALQKGEPDLGNVPAEVFFESLLAMTIEGFFCDPVYGGNKDMVAWEMIGFPGAYANYYELIDEHGMAFKRKPMSLAQDAHGHVRVRPHISSVPARGK